MIKFKQFHKDLDEATFAGSNIKMSGQNDRTIKELSMKKKWKAGVQRALVGPSTKKKPLMFRTMGKDAKEMQKKADVLKTVHDQAKNKLNIAKHVVGKIRKEDTRIKKAGVQGFNKAKRTPGHPTKSHIVVAKVGDKIKTIRFGEQGASTAGDPKKGESDKMKAKRKSFKARHGKNIAKGKMSGAYWANKEKW